MHWTWSPNQPLCHNTAHCTHCVARSLRYGAAVALSDSHKVTCNTFTTLEVRSHTCVHSLQAGNRCRLITTPCCALHACKQLHLLLVSLHGCVWESHVTMMMLQVCCYLLQHGGPACDSVLSSSVCRASHCISSLTGLGHACALLPPDLLGGLQLGARHLEGGAAAPAHLTCSTPKSHHLICQVCGLESAHVSRKCMCSQTWHCLPSR
jgi:hypothetical protein